MCLTAGPQAQLCAGNRQGTKWPGECVSPANACVRAMESVGVRARGRGSSFNLHRLQEHAAPGALPAARVPGNDRPLRMPRENHPTARCRQSTADTTAPRCVPVRPCGAAAVCRRASAVAVAFSPEAHELEPARRRKRCKLRRWLSQPTFLGHYSVYIGFDCRYTDVSQPVRILYSADMYL
jgi:hypothetical protein